MYVLRNKNVKWISQPGLDMLRIVVKTGRKSGCLIVIDSQVTTYDMEWTQLTELEENYWYLDGKYKMLKIPPNIYYT